MAGIRNYGMCALAIKVAVILGQYQSSREPLPLNVKHGTTIVSGLSGEESTLSVQQGCSCWMARLFSLLVTLSHEDLSISTYVPAVVGRFWIRDEKSGTCLTLGNDSTTVMATGIKAMEVWLLVIHS